jgi:hypothetical protein
MNARKVIVSACRELLPASAAQIARGLSYPEQVFSADLNSVRSLFTRGVEGVQCSEAAIASVLDSLIGVADTAGGTLSKNPATGVYSVA